MIDEDKIDYSIYSLGELQEIISGLEDNPPKDKRKKDFQDYKILMNQIFDIYNKKAAFKFYKKLG